MFKEFFETVSKCLTKVFIFLMVGCFILEFIKGVLTGIPPFIKFLINMLIIVGFIGIKIDGFKFCFRKNPAIVIGKDTSVNTEANTGKNKKTQNA